MMPFLCVMYKESSEERSRLLKERLSRLFSSNERRCGRSVLYGADLLQACSVTPGAPHSALSPRGWRWVGRDSCLRAQRTPVATTTHLQSALLSSAHRQDAGSHLVSRYPTSHDGQSPPITVRLNFYFRMDVITLVQNIVKFAYSELS